VNRFVKLLVATIDEAASLVHETEIHVKPPKKYPTPYGGRLVWTLPGKTKMIAHLKDKGKIRHRKRWSQVRIFPCDQDTNHVHSCTFC
jgi:chitin synthase